MKGAPLQPVKVRPLRIVGSPRQLTGVDGQTFADIEEYGEERFLGQLAEEMRTGSYRPSPVRRVWMEKPDGAGGKPLGIPTIRDRVVQTAARLVLEPIFEADFDRAAYACRPGRSPLQAVEEVHRSIIEGRHQVVETDIRAYFDTIPHAELMRRLARRVADSGMLHLIKLWLKSPVEETDERGRKTYSGGRKCKRGIPQGRVISPLLANVYMHRYLKAFRADDLVVPCRRGAAEVLEFTHRCMRAMGLELNRDKARITDARQRRFRFPGYDFGPMVGVKTGRTYLGAAPSSGAVSRLRGRVRAVLHPGNTDPWEVVVAELNSVLRGWGSYFSYGSTTKSRRAVDSHVYDRVVNFLGRRSKLSTRGTRRLPGDLVFGKLGVLSLKTLPRRRPAQALG